MEKEREDAAKFSHPPLSGAKYPDRSSRLIGSPQMCVCVCERSDQMAAG